MILFQFFFQIVAAFKKDLVAVVKDVTEGDKRNADRLTSTAETLKEAIHGTKTVVSSQSYK